MYPETNKFLEFLKPEYNDALKYCKALCSRNSSGDAEDVFQQSLLKALENFDKLNDKSKFRSWFFTIITREFYNVLRKSFWKRFLRIEDYEIAENIPEIPGDEFKDEKKEMLEKVLARLSDKERIAILLFETCGFSIEEIKEVQNEKSISAVKSRLSRTRKKLREYLLKLESKSESGERGYSKNKKSKNILGVNKNETIRLAAETEGK